MDKQINYIKYLQPLYLYAIFLFVAGIYCIDEAMLGHTMRVREGVVMDSWQIFMLGIGCFILSIISLSAGIKKMNNFDPKNMTDFDYLLLTPLTKPKNEHKKKNKNHLTRR